MKTKMLNIIVADDDGDIRLLLVSLLRSRNYEVVGVGSRGELLETLKTFTPDLIMLDVMFGIDDGREICKEIKTGNENVRVILLSADPSRLKNHTIYCADATIEKPFSTGAVLGMITKTGQQY